jgi:hypothetical protein
LVWTGFVGYGWGIKSETAGNREGLTVNPEIAQTQAADKVDRSSAIQIEMQARFIDRQVVGVNS